jgi:NADH-quinone oxidoreductase subunit I
MYGLGLAKGLGVTLKNLLRKPVTIQYPEERPPYGQPVRERGTAFVWYEDRCTVCRTCAKACPHGVITIETTVNERGVRSAARFDVDTAICMVCGFCVEVCPFDALRMGISFENAKFSTAELVNNKEFFRTSPPPPSLYARTPERAPTGEKPELINRGDRRLVTATKK